MRPLMVKELGRREQEPRERETCNNLWQKKKLHVMSKCPYHFPMVIHCLQIPSAASLLTTQDGSFALLDSDCWDAETPCCPPLVNLQRLALAWNLREIVVIAGEEEL